MRIKAVIVPIAALALALGSYSAEAAEQRRGSADRADRGGKTAERSGRRNQAQGQNRGRAVDRAKQRSNKENRGQVARSDRRDSRGNRANSSRARQRDNKANRGQVARSDRRDSRGSRASNSRARQRGNDRGRSVDRRDTRRYKAPRYVQRRSAPRHRYGSRGLNLYFGWGSGYRYGSLYSGRVYGYRGPAPAYGSYRYYGDVRLKISPREAAVYVDGYYAGIVDNFDGFFQRLTLEVGPHEIEVAAPGLESQFYDVYVDASRTISVHGDLRRQRR